MINYGSVNKFIITIIISFMKDNRFFAIFTLILAVGIPLVDISVPFTFGKLIESLHKTDIKDRNSAIIKSCFMFVILIIASRLIKYFSDELYANNLPKLQLFIRENIIWKVIDSIKEDYEQLDVAKLLNQLSKIPWTVENTIRDYRSIMIPFAISILLLALICGYFDFIMGFLILLLAFGFIMSIFLIIPERCMKTSMSRDYQHNRVYSKLEDIFRNLPAIYTEHTEKEEHAEMTEINKQYIKNFVNTVKCYSPIHIIVLFFSIGLISVIIIRGYSLLKVKKLSVANFIFITLVAMNSLHFLMETTEVLGTYVFNIGSVQTLLNYITDTDKNNKGAIIRTVNDNGDKNIVIIESLQLKFGQFKPFSTTIKRGTITIIKGPNGIGKTTLLKAIAISSVITQGAIIVNTSKVGYLPQNPVLWSGTLYQNLIYGHDNPMSIEQFETYLQENGADTILPINRLREQVGHLGSELSGGQKQLAYAIRLFTQKDIELYMLDEPTSWLDSTIKTIFLKLLTKTIKERNITVITVTHDKDILNFGTNSIELVR